MGDSIAVVLVVVAVLCVGYFGFEDDATLRQERLEERREERWKSGTERPRRYIRPLQLFD